MEECHHKKSKDSNRLNYVVLGMAVMLLMFSIGQAVQISALNGESYQEGSTAQPVNIQSGQTPVVTSRPATPAMVGGC